MKYYSYESFRDDTNKLLVKLKEEHFDAIVAIARGGLTLSHAVAEGLEIRAVQSIRTELYDKSQKEKIALFGSCTFANAKRVLVLDDISDSGETLKAVMEHFAAEFAEVEFRSATLL